MVNNLTEGLILFLSFFISGFLIRKIFLPRLEVYTSKTPWLIDKAIVRRMSRWIILWFLLIGLMGGLRYVQFELKHFSVIERILLVSLLISFMFFIAEVVGDFIKSYVRKAEVDIPQVSIFEHFTKWLVVVLGILVILYSLGIPIGPVLTGFGIGGLAVALALQDTLSNFFSGLHLLMSKQIRPGDYVKLESGEEGYVVDITWRNTVIKELPNNYIIVPNAKISKAVIKNYYFPDTELAITISLGVGYSSDLDRVEKITIEVAKEVMREVEGGVPSFEPFVRYHTFSDSSINFNVILRAKEFVDQHLIRHEFLKRLHRRYREEGITIPYPTRMVYLRKKREDIQKNTG